MAVPSLPPAATMTASWLCAQATAARSAGVLPVVHRDVDDLRAAEGRVEDALGQVIERPRVLAIHLHRHDHVRGATPANGMPWARMLLAAMIAATSVP